MLCLFHSIIHVHFPVKKALLNHIISVVLYLLKIVLILCRHIYHNTEIVKFQSGMISLLSFMPAD